MDRNIVDNKIHPTTESHPTPLLFFIMKNISTIDVSLPLACKQKGAPLCFWVEGRAEPCTSEGLGQPAKLHGKATPQVKRVSSCKPRVSVLNVQILRRQGLQTFGRSCRPSRRRVASLGYVGFDIPIKRLILYHKTAIGGGRRATGVRGGVGVCWFVGLLVQSTRQLIHLLTFIKERIRLGGTPRPTADGRIRLGGTPRPTRRRQM